MNYFFKYASLLIDNSHRYFTNKKHAAVTLEDDFFDNKKYSPGEFYDYTKQFFDSPELFFSEGDRPDFSAIKNLKNQAASGIICLSESRSYSHFKAKKISSP